VLARSRWARLGQRWGWLSALVALLALVSGACEREPQVLQPTYSTREEIFQTEVVNLGLERLGFAVDAPGQQLGYAAAHAAIAEGNSDYAANHWNPLHDPFFQSSGGESALQRLDTIVAPALQGYLVDGQTARAVGLSSLQQLRQPEIAERFDTDGDGRANLLGCNPGWQCESVIEHHLQEYGLEDTVEQEQGIYSDMMADAIERFERGEPILYYGWIPSWVGAVLQPGSDVQWLTVPYTSLPQRPLTAEDTQMNGQNLGFPANQIQTLANAGFAQRHPVVRRWLELVEIPISDLNAEYRYMRRNDATPADIRDRAQDWIAQHERQVERWLERARNAAR